MPSGSEFNRPPPEQAAVLPAPDAAPNAAAPTAPQADGVQPAPMFDTAPAAQPRVASTAPSGIAAEAEPGDQPQAAASAPEAPLVPETPVTLPQPSASATPEVQTIAAPAPEPDAPEEDVAAEVEASEDVTPDEVVPPQVDVADADPAEPVESPADEGASPAEAIAELDETEPETPALRLPRLPTIGGDIGGGALGGSTADPVAPPRFPQTSRLPQNLGDEMGADTGINGGTAPEAEDAEMPASPPGGLRAIEAFAAPFGPAETRALLAVILIDEPDSAIDLATLTGLSFPVAFAVDALHPDAADRAQAYRAAGFEVVMFGAFLIDGATAQDTEEAVGAVLALVPEAVALLDTPDHRIQGDRPVLDATVAALAETGHGLVAFPRGLNAAEQSAARAGVPGATVFRMLDASGETAPGITRSLTRAAFAAAQEGGVVVVGHTRPATVTALSSWALGDRSEVVALAPLSAVLLRDEGN